jgi:hypothetical protein
MMASLGPRAVLCLALTVPAAGATLAVLAFVVSESAGETPFSYGPPMNLAEAAGMGRGPEVVRMLGAGHDPNRLATVRPEIISSMVTRVTALEAVIWSRRRELVQVLDDHGAIVDRDTRRALACLAIDLTVEDIAAYLAPSGDPGCVPGQAIERVLARSRRADPDR